MIRFTNQVGSQPFMLKLKVGSTMSTGGSRDEHILNCLVRPKPYTLCCHGASRNRVSGNSCVKL